MRKLFSTVLSGLLVTGSLAAAVIAAPRAQAQGGAVLITLNPTPLMAGTIYEGATATAVLDKTQGYAIFTLTMPEGFSLPESTVFEGFIIDPGQLAGATGSTEGTSASKDDITNGVRYNDPILSNLAESIPYYLTMGALTDNGDGTYSSVVLWENYNLGPYDNVSITVETDGNETPWDPRPGGAILRGVIADGTPTDTPDIEALVGAMPDMSVSQGISLQVTEVGSSLGFGEAEGRAFVLIESGAAEVEIEIPDGVLPEGAVLEAFISDGGRLGNFGPSNTSASDNGVGPAFLSAYLSNIADAIPWSSSLGTLARGEDGVYRVKIHWDAYALRVYDVLIITLEADGNVAPWNPRPGTPIMVGALSPNAVYDALLAAPPAP
jgi:hypothetical protein